jgi:predicted DNA-binding ribbon-helix-helix protein
MNKSIKPNKGTTGFYIEDDLLKKVKEIAVKKRISVSAIVNNLMEQYINDNKKG